MIIGFTGKKRSGKDTAASVFIAEGFRQVSFADPMKLMMKTLLQYRGMPENLIDRHLHDDLKESYTGYLSGNTPRHALQTLGTEWGRNLLHPDFWIETFRDHVKDSGENIVIADVRFDNEAAAIIDMGGEVIEINRPSLSSLAEDTHPSEGGVSEDLITMTLLNNFETADAFKAYVRYVLIDKQP